MPNFGGRRHTRAGLRATVPDDVLLHCESMDARIRRRLCPQRLQTDINRFWPFVCQQYSTIVNGAQQLRGNVPFQLGGRVRRNHCRVHAVGQNNTASATKRPRVKSDFFPSKSDLAYRLGNRSRCLRDGVSEIHVTGAFRVRQFMAVV